MVESENQRKPKNKISELFSFRRLFRRGKHPDKDDAFNGAKTLENQQLDQYIQTEKAHLDQAAEIEKKIANIQRSTRTTFSAILPVHNYLHMRLKWYYYWHMKKFSTSVHWSVLLIFVLMMMFSIASGGFSGFSLVNRYQKTEPAKAVGTKTWQNGGVDNNWSTAGNWVEGSKPAAGEDVVIAAAWDCVVNEASANLNSLNMTGYANTLSGSSAINVVGAAASTVSVKFAGTITWTGTLNLNPVAADTNIELTSNGKTIRSIYIGGHATGDVYFLDGIVGTGVVIATGNVHTDGLTDNAGLSHNCWKFQMSGSGTRIVNLGNSSITMTNTGTTNTWVASGTNLTLTAGTSTITFTGASPTMNVGASKTYYNVVFTSSTFPNITNCSGAIFNALTINGPASQVGIFYLDNNITVNGSLNLNGSSAINRLLFRSNTIGTVRTITLGASAICKTGNTQFVDIQDIVLAGGAANERDLSTAADLIGDCGGNTGITFLATSAEVWTDTNGGSWSDVGNWTARIPLPQDTVTWIAMGVSKTITVDMPRLPATDFSSATNTPTVNLTTTGLTYTWYGTVNLTGVGTYTCNKALAVIVRANASITSAGKTFVSTNGYFRVYAPGCTVTFSDAFTCNDYLQLNLGTLTVASNVTAYRYVSITGTTVNMGNGTWTVSYSGTAWTMATGTINAQGSTIALTNTNSVTFSGGINTYNDIVITPGASNLVFSGAFTFANMTMASAGIKSVYFTKSTTYTMTGTNFLSGSATGDITLDTADGAGTFQLTKSGGGVVSCDYLNISRSVGDPATTWYAGANSHDTTGNSGWVFTAPPTLITVSGSANGNNGATVKIAVDAVEQTGKTAVIGSSAWSISGVIQPTNGQIITVWVDAVTDDNETTCVAKYNGANPVSGMVLNTNILSIGSSEDQSLIVTNLGLWTNTQNEDVMHTVTGTGTILNVDGASSYTTEKIDILTGDTLAIGTAETLNTHHLSITGNLTSSGNATYNVAGDWLNTGTFTASTSTVTFNGGGSQNITAGGSNFNNLTDGNTATEVSQSSAVTITTLTVNASANYDINGQNITLTTLTNNGTFRMQGGETTVTITNKDTTHGTVEYDGTGDYTGFKYGNTHNHLEIHSTGAGTWAMNAAVTVNGTFTMNAGTLTFPDAGSQSITSNSLVYDGGTITINDQGTYRTKWTTSSYSQSSGTFTVGRFARVYVNGSLTMSGGTYTTRSSSATYITGDCNMASGTVTATDGGSFWFNTNGATFTPSASTYFNLYPNKTAGQTLTIAGNITCSGSFKVKSGSLDPGTYRLTMNGNSSPHLDLNGQSLYDVTIANTIYVNDNNGGATHSLTASGGATLMIQSGRTFTMANGATTTITGSIRGVGTLTLVDSAGANLDTAGTLGCIVRFETATANAIVPARSYGRLEVYNASGSNYSVVLGTAGSQTITVAGDIIWSLGGAFYTYANGAGNITVDGDTNDPAVSISTYTGEATHKGKIDYLGTAGGTESILAGGGIWTVQGDINFTDGTFNAGASTFVLNGTTALTSAAQAFNNIQLGTASAGGSLTLSDDANIDGNFSVQNGGATALSAAGRTVSFAGGVNLSNLDVPTLSGSKFVFDGASSLTSAGISLDNIQIGSATAGGVLTLADNLDQNADLTALNGGATALTISNRSVYFSANINLTNLDIFTSTGSTAIFDGTTALTMAGYDFNNIQIGSASAGGSLTLADDMIINGSVSVTDFSATGWVVTNRSVSVNGNLDLTNLDTFTSTSSIFNFTGTTNLTSAAKTFNSITLGTAFVGASLTLTDNIDINGNLTVLDGGATTLIVTNRALNCAGNFNLTNLDTFTAGGSTVNLDGGGVQMLTTAGKPLVNLIVSNSSGSIVTLADSTTVSGTFTNTTGDSKMNFAAGGIFTLANINLNGAASHLITMHSTADNTAWYFIVAAVDPTVTYTDVRDSDATGSNAMIDTAGAVNSGGNINWNFPTASTTLITDSSGNNIDNYGFEEKAYVTVSDLGKNVNPVVAETVDVVITSAAPASDSETITLTETAVNTGVFRNTTGLDIAPFKTTKTVGDGTLHVDRTNNTITATYTDATDPTDVSSDTATATVFGPAFSVIVTPASATIVSGGTAQFSAVVYDKNDLVLSDSVSWSVIAGGGTINSSGLFTAGASAGAFSDTIKATTTGSISSTASVTVSDSPQAAGSSTSQVSTSTDTEAPEVKIDAPESAEIDTVVSFDGSGSTDNVGITSYSWDFGDDSVGKTAKTSHSFRAFNNFTVALEITDAAGNKVKGNHKISIVPPTPILTSMKTAGSILYLYGTAYPKIEIAIIIRSDPIEIKTTANDDGKWQAKVDLKDKNIASGQHKIFLIASAKAADGTTATGETDLQSEKKDYNLKVTIDNDQLLAEIEGINRKMSTTIIIFFVIIAATVALILYLDIRYNIIYRRKLKAAGM